MTQQCVGTSSSSDFLYGNQGKVFMRGFAESTSTPRVHNPSRSMHLKKLGVEHNIYEQISVRKEVIDKKSTARAYGNSN